MKPLTASFVAIIALSHAACSDSNPPAQQTAKPAAPGTQPPAPVVERQLSSAATATEHAATPNLPPVHALPDPAADKADDEAARVLRDRDAKQATEEAARRILDAAREAVKAVRQSAAPPADVTPVAEPLAE
ncbi:MAG TPA: hypothetical protein PKM39_02480 [Pseudothauera hydrothermalis]|nr:hypothetical protein [Pseudothauera hydrothermalis]